MILIQCVNAYMALTELMEQEWNYNEAYKLLRLKESLQPRVNFFTQEEMKLAQEYGVKDERGRVIFDERGSFRFEDPARAQEYTEKRRELGLVTVDEIKPIHLSAPQKIKPLQLEALRGVIEFERTDEI